MNAESVKARLKNFAVSSGCTFQDALVYYGLERTIYRLSVSPYASHFVLNGGIFLYAIFDRKYERATTDVDLLARRISNSAEEMKDVFRNIFAQDTDVIRWDIHRSDTELKMASPSSTRPLPESSGCSTTITSVVWH